MKPDNRFQQQPKSFWAYVRSVSEKDGYTDGHTKQVKTPSLRDILQALQALGLSTSDAVDLAGQPTELGSTLVAYFRHRADVLNAYVEPRLMDADRAREVFKELRGTYRPKCPIPMNKQRGKKKGPAYFTGMVNILIEAYAGELPCEYDPLRLTTITRDHIPLRTLARRVDGAFPSASNPIAVWEIKEYYHTTTFGSRVADGIYETLLDGMELEELRDHEGVDVKHYLMVDSHNTWWELGKSYLCRIIDMLHMGYLDEALFGHEVVERLPEIVAEWVAIARDRGL
jgi:hypothetical protein